MAVDVAVDVAVVVAVDVAQRSSAARAGENERRPLISLMRNTKHSWTTKVKIQKVVNW